MLRCARNAQYQNPEATINPEATLRPADLSGPVTLKQLEGVVTKGGLFFRMLKIVHPGSSKSVKYFSKS